MLTVRLVPPAADLAPLVRHFRIAVARLAPGGLRNPMTARAEQFLEFYLGAPPRVVEPGEGAREALPTPKGPALVGPQTQRGYDLIIAASAHTFTIHFAPGGLYRLFGVPVSEFADVGTPAEDVAGPVVAELDARLRDCADDTARVACAEAWLRVALRRRAAPALIAPFAGLGLARGADVAAVARGAGISVRQLERRFLREAGLSPKLFGRIARLQRALAWRAQHPALSWAAVAAAAGYFDQMHLVRDFRALAGDAPSGFERASAPRDRALRQGGEREQPW
jgi:AraC-like DNA-binding protein